MNNNDGISEIDDYQTTKRKSEFGSIGTFIQNHCKRASNYGA